MLSVLFRFTDSDYPFCMFKFFFMSSRCIHVGSSTDHSCMVSIQFVSIGMLTRKVWRYQAQTIQWPKKKKNLKTNNGHVTKHYSENKRLSNATSMKSGVGDSGAPEESAVTALLMAPVVLLLLKCGDKVWKRKEGRNTDYDKLNISVVICHCKTFEVITST